MASQQLLEAETPLQVLVLSGAAQAAFLTFSNGFSLIRSRWLLYVKCYTIQWKQYFVLVLSFHFVSLAFSSLSRLR